MSTENIVTGRFYRILKDKTNDIWDRISFWTHSDDVQTASGITLTTDLSRKESKISSTQSDFAKVETSSVASQAYVKGNMLVYNNQLYRVKAAIASGGTLTPGTNIEAVNVGTISNMLNTSDGKGFYFDVKDGSYGFYPSASKVASEFVPFGGSDSWTSVSIVGSNVGSAGTATVRSNVTCGKCEIILVTGSYYSNQTISNIPSTAKNILTSPKNSQSLYVGICITRYTLDNLANNTVLGSASIPGDGPVVIFAGIFY